MRTVNGTRTEILIAVFTFAIFYGSVCSAACAVGVCPNLADYAESHDCDQPVHPHSHTSQPPDSKDANCKQHAHPPDFALKVLKLPLHQGHSVAAIHSAARITNLAAAFSLAQDVTQASDLAPPGFLSNPQQISVLRI